ncbi:hypothetical protein KR026_011567 [Drosophila bipectinata]|nr:hypothetical protein KR026_011567 [Drosophila bipectinata]
MDILDIDEALKDDSYIFQADKTHDDVSNILQQWKTNNQPQLQMQMHLQCNNEAYKHNTKTFTRPKRRNLDFQSQNGAGNDSGVGTPAMLQLEIGGLVTTNMHKSFLQDTSPPSSICSSMNTERMNNSLITSADFTNLNFLQSTLSLEQDPSLTTTLTNQTTDNMVAGMGMGLGGGLAGYTLSDMIRDRKALESLTLCEEDGTLTKDSHIGQIDEISLTLSKTASGCSTMDNSTDSMSNPLAPERPMPAAFPVLQRTMILGEEMIGDTTFNLVDSLTTSVLQSDAESMPMDGNATFKRPSAASSAAAPAADETLLLAGRQMNTTYTEGCNTPEARCETPENVERKLALLTMESTPLTTNIRPHYYHNNNNKQGYTPTLKGRGDMNLSPIVSVTPQKPTGAPARLNNTFEPAAKAAPFDGEKFVLDTMELLEQIEQPLDGTYSLQMSEQHKQMQCVMDLAEAEVELLAQQGDEEQFEHMLAELGKVNTLNEVQLKMQKSLDTIKRRFHRDEPEAEPEREEEEPKLQTPVDKVETPTLNQSHSSSNNSSSGTGERLLSRRSRLYDDVNLSVMHGSNGSSASCNSASFIVQRRDVPQEEQPAPEPEPEPAEEQPRSQVAAETDPSSYKLAERRERDRERFKTIKISRDMRLQQEIIVPCIDDEPQQLEDPPQEAVEDEDQLQEAEQQPQRQASQPSRLSRRDQNLASNNNNYKAEGSASNYLTYKKPKEKSLLQRPTNAHPSAESTLPQPRSLSRPRYISGLQKFTTVSKATSAGAGLNSTTAAVPVAVPVPSSTELKSPMGIKSKSFHNLSSTMSGIAGGAGAGALPRPSLGGGLRRPGAPASKLTSGLRVASQSQEDDSGVFKVPKLVSGLRGPGLAGAKRAGGNGLARPSSGYYSLSTKTDADTPESLSSASSRGSLYGHKDSGRTVNGGNVPQQNPPQAFDTQALTSKLTQVTTGSTGIPKPSGLRPPSQMKRSGLPRPSSIVRR